MKYDHVQEMCSMQINGQFCSISQHAIVCAQPKCTIKTLFLNIITIKKKICYLFFSNKCFFLSSFNNTKQVTKLGWNTEVKNTQQGPIINGFLRLSLGNLTLKQYKLESLLMLVS